MTTDENIEQTPVETTETNTEDDITTIEGKPYTNSQITALGMEAARIFSKPESVRQLHADLTVALEGGNKPAEISNLDLDLTGDNDTNMIKIADALKAVNANLQAVSKNNVTLQDEFKGYVNQISQSTITSNTAQNSAEALGAKYGIKVTSSQLEAYMSDTGYPAEDALKVKRFEDIKQQVPQTIGFMGDGKQTTTFDLEEFESLNTTGKIAFGFSHPELQQDILDAQSAARKKEKKERKAAMTKKIG